jgi:anti-anti-sigma factor
MRPPLDAPGHRTARDHTSVEVTLAGKLDMVATFNLEPEVDRLLAENSINRLVLNLAQVRFIDSAGVGTLVSIRERTEQVGVELVLANVPGPVQRVLDLTCTAVLSHWSKEPGVTSGPSGGCGGSAL